MCIRDRILPEAIKAISANLIDYMTNLFNVLYDKGIFPLEWATAIIVPIHKKGSKSVPNNFRGISLLSILSKVYTSILTFRLACWAEDNGKLSQSQAGFRRGYSTIDHIHTLTQIVSNGLYGDRRHKTFCVFIDFNKAFNTVKHDKLWEVLRKAGVSSKFIKTL